MKKRIDCFPYFNEKELLELRYHLLKDHFDFFVVTDANRTHTGDPKAFTAKQTIKELGLDENKFRVIEVNLPSKEEEPDDHVRERMQRNAAAEYITWNTVAFVGDADEIIDPKYLDYYESIVRGNPNNILHVPMFYLMGRADLRDYTPMGQPRFWANCYMCMGHHKEKYTLSEMRESYSEQTKHCVYQDIFAYDNGVIEPAGWHFSWMGDVERLQTKFKSFMHFGDFIEDTEYSQQPDKMLEYIDSWKPEAGKPDPLGRLSHILRPFEVEKLPQIIFDLPRVKEFLFPQTGMTVVQVGTNRANDALSNYLLNHQDELKFGLFVEPNELHIDSIKECYKKYKNVVVENVAVVPADNKEKSVTMYYHTGDGPGYEVTSCNIDHVTKHVDEGLLTEGEIKSFSVPCITLEALLDKHKLTKIDWLLLDVEGIDLEIIKSFNWKKYNISRIEFEHLHLGEEKEQVEQFFVDMGYTKVPSLHEFDWAFKKTKWL